MTQGAQRLEESLAAEDTEAAVGRPVRAHRNLTALRTVMKLARLAGSGDARGDLARVVAGGRRLARLVPRNPLWARLAAPLLPPGYLRGALVAYGRPREFAITAAVVGGVAVLDALQRSRTDR